MKYFSDYLNIRILVEKGRDYDVLSHTWKQVRQGQIVATQ